MCTCTKHGMVILVTLPYLSKMGVSVDFIQCGSVEMMSTSHIQNTQETNQETHEFHFYIRHVATSQ